MKRLVSCFGLILFSYISGDLGPSLCVGALCLTALFVDVTRGPRGWLSGSRRSMAIGGSLLVNTLVYQCAQSIPVCRHPSAWIGCFCDWGRWLYPTVSLCLTASGWGAILIRFAWDRYHGTARSEPDPDEATGEGCSECGYVAELEEARKGCPGCGLVSE